MIEAVVLGTQQVVTEGTANFGQWVPSIGVIEAPYVWRDAAHLAKVMAGPIGEDLNKQLIEKRGCAHPGDDLLRRPAPHHHQEGRPDRCGHEGVQAPRARRTRSSWPWRARGEPSRRP